MKLNNKGMSIIEIVISFTLVMLMVTGMLTIVVNYRNKAALSIEKLEMNTFKNTLTQDIQNDILTLGIEEINSDGECPTLTGLDNCINLVFDDGSEKAFGVSKVSANDRESIEKKYLYYDGIKYKLHEVLPEVIPEGRNMVDLQSIVVENKNFLTTDSAILEDGTTVTIYSIDVYISHIDFQDDFGIHVIATTDNAELIGNSRYLRTAVLQDNELITTTPTLTTSSNNTSDKNGLYKSTATNSGNPTYYFRGHVNNNYVNFAEFTWRIIRINEDGTIRVIMENSINDNTNYIFNSNLDNKKYMYYTNSNVKTQLETWYSNKIANNLNYSNKIATGDYYCEQAKIASSDTYVTYSGTNMIVYKNYENPNFKCTTDSNGYGIINAAIGLLSYDELLHAGGYHLKSNSNYYLNNNSIWWLISTAGFADTVITSAFSWFVTNVGSINTDYLDSTNKSLRPVINLKANVTASGLGTKDNPYVID